jgi:hypothetical protein
MECTLFCCEVLLLDTSVTEAQKKYLYKNNFIIQSPLIEIISFCIKPGFNILLDITNA